MKKITKQKKPKLPRIFPLRLQTDPQVNLTGTIDAAAVRKLFLDNLPIPINFGPVDRPSSHVKFIPPGGDDGQYETLQQALEAEGEDEEDMARIMEDFEGFKEYIFHYNIVSRYVDAIVENTVSAQAEHERVVTYIVDIDINDRGVAERLCRVLMYDLSDELQTHKRYTYKHRLALPPMTPPIPADIKTYPSYWEQISSDGKTITRKYVHVFEDEGIKDDSRFNVMLISEGDKHVVHLELYLWHCDVFDEC